MRRTSWFTAAAVLALASIVMGAVVCATQSGASCPNWPGCYAGQFLPVPAAGLATNPLVEFAHRVVAGATGPVVLVAALLGRRLADPRPRILAWVALGGALAAGVFGMLTVRVGIPWWLGMVDLACALAATVAMIRARLLLTRPLATPTPTSRLAWAAVGTLGVMHLLGIAVAGENSFTRCLSWPLGLVEVDRWPLVQALRLALALTAAVLIALSVVRALRSTDLRGTGLLVAGLLVAELALAVAMLGGAGVGVRTLYAVVAAALFAAVALLASLAGLPAARQATPVPDTAPQPV
ncbi:COX15/CtaA family protein [Propionicimonas sp.]|uniref:COX15/CtaA family protein n=1 Tax=Propionicimonas sp. TaxID=1955623 RepID=UPI0039E3B7C0